MKYGFAIIPHWPVSDVVELIQLGEDLGYDHAWMTDQTFFEDPFVTLSVAGQKTESINLGVGVTNPYTRLPSSVARAIGTMGNLMERPVALGIGAGNRRELIKPLGMEQSGTVSRMREMALLVRSLLKGENVNFESQYNTLKDVQLKFKPEQSAPIYLAGRGPKTLELGGTVADGVIIGDLISDSGLDYAIQRIETGRKKENRSEDAIERVVWVATFVTDGYDPEIVDGLRPWVAHHMAASPSVVQKALGMSDAKIKEIREAYASGGATEAGKHVTDAEVDTLALVGPPDKILASLERFEKRRIGQFVFLLYSKSLQENRDTLKRFAREVMERARK